MKAMMFRAVLAASLLFLGRLAPVQAQGIQYLSPSPQSEYNPPGTTIAVRYGDTLDQNDVDTGHFHVSGTTSGQHSGTVVLSDDQKTLIFKPDQPFTLTETINVTVDAWTGQASGTSHPPANFSFKIAPVEGAAVASTTGQLVPQNGTPEQPGADAAGRYVTVPVDFPDISVVSPENGAGPGYIFATNFQLSPGPSGYYLMILDNNGEPVYYQKLAADSRSLDFTELPNGTLAYSDLVRNAFIIMDNRYREIDTIRPGNGFQSMDEHDLRQLPNGHYLLLASEARPVDMSQVVSGGNPKASVTGQVVQELDRNKNVVFQWRALDYLSVGDTTESLTTPQIDFTHANAMDLDSDGNLLLSIRHLDTIVKIDRQTGAIVWQLGGKHNQFNFSTAPGVSGPPEFYHQHDVRLLPNGHISIFDNHNDHDPKVSRALEYVLDENARTATLVWAYATDPAPYAIAMGNVQQLANGDRVIGWGTNLFPQITEVKPDGSKALELDLGGSNATYRAFRFPWQGFPTWPPALVQQASGNDLKLTFSWNGATEVSSYRVYGGDRLPLTDVVAEQPKAGFETSVTLPNARDGYCYYQVMPIDSQGNPTQMSAPVGNPVVQGKSCTLSNSFWVLPW